MRELYILLLFHLALSAQGKMTMYSEIHPSAEKCNKQCGEKYGESNKEQCDACCFGCRVLSITGVASLDGKSDGEDAQDACYKNCKDGYVGEVDIAACKVGCEMELKVAEKELENMAQDPMLEMPTYFEDILKSFDQFLGQNFYSEDDHRSQLPEAFEKAKEPMTDDEWLDNFLNNLFGGNEFQTNPKQPAVYYDDDHGHHEHDHHNHDNGVNPPAPDRIQLRSDESHEGTEYLRRMWRDRNTVQLLLITSLTACLLAIVWLLCGSSNDPIVRTQPILKSPPAYETLFGNFDEKKKLPILVFADTEEAGPLPIKEKMLDSSLI